MTSMLEMRRKRRREQMAVQRRRFSPLAEKRRKTRMRNSLEIVTGKSTTRRRKLLKLRLRFKSLTR